MLQTGSRSVVELSGCACKMHGIGIESVKGLGAYFRSLVHRLGGGRCRRLGPAPIFHRLASPGWVRRTPRVSDLSRGGRQADAARRHRVSLVAVADRARNLSVPHRQVRGCSSHLSGEFRRPRHLLLLADRRHPLFPRAMDGRGAARGGARQGYPHRGLGHAAASLGLVALLMLGAAGLFRSPTSFAVSPLALAFFGVITALGYATGLTLSVQSVHRASEDAVRIGEDRYRLLAENTSDLITRHDERGRVVFASLAAQSMFGELAGKTVRRWLVRARPYRRSSGLSHGAVACYASQLADGGRVQGTDRARPATDAISGSKCVAVPSIRRRSEREKLRAGVVAVTRDITERKTQEEETRARARRRRERKPRQDAIPCQYESRASDTAQRRDRLR